MKRNLLFGLAMCVAIGFVNSQTLRSFISPASSKVNSATNMELKKMLLSPTKHMDRVKKGDLTELSSFNFVKIPHRADSEIGVIYPRPAGAYHIGINEEGKSRLASFFVAGAMSPIYFIPYTSSPEVEISWFVNDKPAPDELLEDDMYKFTGNPNGMYYLPELRGTLGAASASYMYGKSNKDGSVLATGSGESNPLTNADVTLGENNLYAGYESGDDFSADYVVDGVACTGVASLFQRPNAPLYIETVTALTTTAIVGEDKLDIAIHRVKDDGTIMQEVIGKGYATSEDCKAVSNFYAINFKFYEVDEDGFTTQIPLTISDSPFVVMITGIKSGMKFLFGGAEFSGSAFTLHGDKLSSMQYENGNNANDLYIELNAIYNCLSVESSTDYLAVPNEGGLAVDSEGKAGTIVYSSFTFDDSLPEEKQPLWIADKSDWITKVEYDDSAYKDYSALIFGITGDKLPSNETGRDGYVTLGSYGVSCTIHVLQGDAVSSISSAKPSFIKANCKNSNFELNYTENVTSVQIINVAGQTVGTYPLEGTSATIPATNLAKGLYLLKFNTGATVKVMK